MDAFLESLGWAAREVGLALLFMLGMSVPQQVATSTVNYEDAVPQSGVNYSVTKVVDGDTISIDLGGVKRTVRMIGLNTPETVDPRRPVECFGKEASSKMKELLSGREVRLEFDASQGTYDKYHRLLAYVYRDDGVLINKYMIEEGYGHEYTYNVPYEFQKTFKQAERDAKFHEKGLWAPGVCEGT